MRARFAVFGLVAALIAASFAWPVAVGAASGISVAPQAGAPGVQFAISGAGLTPNAAYMLLVERGMVFSRTFDIAADARGRFAFTLDSTGYVESENYSATVVPKGGGAFAGSTRFAVQSGQPERYFAETGHTVRGRFLAYWEAHGGLAINGFPLSDEFSEVLENGQPFVVQYFERTRLEYHPESTDPQYTVLLGQFGRRIRPDAPAGMPDPTKVWFPETKHNVPNDLYAYWSANGGLTQFGYPISEVLLDQLEDGKTYEVQYFERGRLERHPENPMPYDILLGQFGRMIYAQVAR